MGSRCNTGVLAELLENMMGSSHLPGGSRRAADSMGMPGISSHMSPDTWRKLEEPATCSTLFQVHLDAYCSERQLDTCYATLSWDVHL